MSAEKKQKNLNRVTAPPPQLQKKKSWGFLLIWPAFLYILAIVIVYPFIYNIYRSLFDYSMLTGTSKFVGFSNYGHLLKDPEYLNSISISIGILIVALVIETVLGLIIAVMLNQNFKGKVVARILLILPLGTIPIINGFMFTVLFFPGGGVVDHILMVLHIIKEPIAWLQEPWLARIVIVLVDVWQWTSFMIIMILAGLSAVPERYYELAKLDNMSCWKVFWRITLPKIKFTLVLAMLIRMMDLLKYFDPVFAITQGGPQSATETVSFFIYRIGFKAFKVGYASAASLMVWLIIWVMSFIIISKVFTKKEELI